MGSSNESIAFGNSTGLQNDVEIVDYSPLPLESLVPAWSKSLLITFIAIAMVLGVPGNSLVLTILLKIKRKTSTDLFVIFIAICDIISLTFNGTVYIMIFCSGVWDRVSNSFLCKLHIYIVHFVFWQSACLITCIGIDRYFKTCRPHTLLFTPKSSLWCCVVLTVFSALFNTSHMFTTKLNADGRCILDDTKALLRISLYAVLLVLVLGSSVALCVMYSKIAIQIRTRMRVNPVMVSYIQSGLRHKTERTAFSELSRRKQRDASLSQEHEIESSHVKTKETRFGISNVTELVSSMSRSRSRIRVRQSELSVQAVFASCSNTESWVKDVHQNEATNDNKNNTPKTVNQTNYREEIQENPLQMSRMTKQVNKTTKIMGAITCVYIISTVIPTFTVGILTALNDVKQHEVGRIIVFFVLRLYFINNFANPIFYIWLSSAFRKKAMAIFTACKKW